MYIGVSPSQFDIMVSDGRMPTGFLVGKMRLWDRVDLDRSFDDLKEASDGGQGWDDV